MTDKEESDEEELPAIYQEWALELRGFQKKLEAKIEEKQDAGNWEAFAWDMIRDVLRKLRQKRIDRGDTPHSLRTAVKQFIGILIMLTTSDENRERFVKGEGDRDHDCLAQDIDGLVNKYVGDDTDSQIR